MKKRLCIYAKKAWPRPAKRPAAWRLKAKSNPIYIWAEKSVSWLKSIPETDFVAKGEAFQNFCHEIALQICASNPEYVKSEDIPQDRLDQERAIFRKQVIESGKPEKIADKIVDGKLSKFFSEICLLMQPWNKEPAKSIDDLRKELVAKTGENITIRRFARFVLGEGIEKKKNDLAAEVASQIEASKKN